jgi:prepilin-type N-terminal cleavage/methylation domain-containing protein
LCSVESTHSSKRSNLKKAFTLIELLIVVAIIGILAGVGIPMYNGYMAESKKVVVKQNCQTVVKWIQMDAMKCKLNGGDAFRQFNDNGGGHSYPCSQTDDNGPFYEGRLQTHIGSKNWTGNPYGNIAEDKSCDLAKSWGKKSVQSAHLGKKMCRGAIGLYTLAKNKNGCDREMIVQCGVNDAYWTFTDKESEGVLSTKICIRHK